MRTIYVRDRPFWSLFAPLSSVEWALTCAFHSSDAPRNVLGNCAALKADCYTSRMTLDELTAQLREAMSANSGAGADLQKNLRATLAAGLSKLDVVTRQEFEIQREMLDVLRKQVETLSAQVAEYEAKKTSTK
jgi:ubiquinone biosynthesis accessory factor UbiK